MASALIVVDVQQELVDALEPQRRAGFLDTLGVLIARARASGTPVVYVRHNDDELRPGTAPWEIASPIAPLPGDAIVDKRYRDAFRETDLQTVLSRLDADHVIVCGMQTEFCVDATVREAERRGYAVTLAADAHATYSAEGETEEQIRAHVHRVAKDRVARILPTAELFDGQSLVKNAS